MDYCVIINSKHTENSLDERRQLSGEADVIKLTGEADRMIDIYKVDLMVYLVILDITRIDNIQSFYFL